MTQTAAGIVTDIKRIEIMAKSNSTPAGGNGAPPGDS
jgi:hypothetical protein